MQRIEEFIQEFLKEQLEMRRAWLEHSAPFDKKFYAPECINQRERAFLLDSPPEAVEGIKSSETSAEVVTSGYRYRNLQHRRRYHLQATGQTWQIRCIDAECCVCHATGKNKSGSGPCRVCNGKGWISTDEPA